jgi:hypothetical protein
MGWFTTARRTTERRAAPTWSDDRRGTRILVEHADPTIRDVLRRDLEARGFDVLTCAGPGPDGAEAASCPLLHQERCPAVDGADLVASGLSLTSHVTHMVLRRIADQGTPPLVVEVPHQTAERIGAGIADRHLFPMRADAIARIAEDLPAR